MPIGPEDQRRSTDAIGNAVGVAQITTGASEGDFGCVKPNKNEAAAELGRKGAAARSARMTPERRSEIARKAAAKRWEAHS